jgi:hypothetical protein
VAAFKGGPAFISEAGMSGCAVVHCAFRRWFQILCHIVPCDYRRSLRHIGRGRGCAWPLRSSHRQFVGHLARQFLRRWRFAWLAHRRWHLGPWISGRAFLRWLRGAARLDRWILLRIDRHLMLFPELFETPTARRPQGSISGRAISTPTGCCCGSCRPRRSRARACRRCSRPAIRCATNVRLPPRAATMIAAHP